MRNVLRLKARGQRRVARGWSLTPQLSTLNRTGATLSEILISLMVMGIGVTSLALLISTSVLRSIQASQLTNATIHRLNAEELIDLFPRLVHNPDNNVNVYLGIHEIQNQLGGLDNPDNSVDGVNQGRFIVDPLGATHANLTAAVQGVFGNDGGAAPTNPIRRYHGGFNDVTPPIAPSADPRIAYLSDNWQLAAKGVVSTTPDALSITVPSGVDLATANAALNATTPVRVRVVLFSLDGRQSVTRELTATSIDTGTDTITWADDVPTAAPFAIDTDSDGVPDTLTFSRFRLETFDPRYSWLLTVRKTPGVPLGQGTANVDVVVFHKRAFSAAAEQVYTTNLTQGNTSCTITVPGGGSKPFLKKGGFLFDAQHAHWYRITKIVEGTNPVVTIDRPAVTASNRVLALPGIVEVYPVGSITFDPNNPP